MKKTAGLILLGVSSILGSANAFIDDGIVAKQNAFPSVVKIVTVQAADKNTLSTSSCTGTLIAPDVVVTAAHCTAQGKSLQFVSLAGDSEAKMASLANVSMVKGSLVTSQFEYYSNEHAKSLAKLQTKEFNRLSEKSRSKLAYEELVNRLTMTNYDIAFLWLDKPQTGKNVKISKFGCRSSLVPGAKITLAGYGQKSVKNSKENYNPAGSLNYGINTLAENPAPGNVYFINAAEGKQLINSGDSGGPLFLKGNSATVYGVASQKYVDPLSENNIGGMYANLSSTIAYDFYQQVIDSEVAPESLKNVLKSCFN